MTQKINADNETMTADRDVQVLVVDDEEPIRRMVSKLVKHCGFRCLLACNGEEALILLEKEPIDVVVTDISMPEMDGIELTKRIKSRYDTDVIMMTGYIKDLTYGDAISKGASDFLQKPFDTEEFQIRLKRVLKERRIYTELKESLRNMQMILDGVIHSLSSTVEARDPYTSGHQKRVSALAAAIAGHMKLPKNMIKAIQMAGLIHDLGKIAIPAEILSKPGRLSESEFNLLKTHPQVGYDILKDISFPMPISEIIYQHHERLNGQGYPRKLKGDTILLESRIIAVADVVEAMSSHRPYRPALGIEKALEEISMNKGSCYDPDVVDSCLKLINSDMGLTEFDFS